MNFYQSDPSMKGYLRDLINKLSYENRPDFHNNISITWIRYNTKNPLPGSGIGASWYENKLFYPASIVKIIYAIATAKWLQNDLITESEEVYRALSDMITHSSNDATSYIVDILTGTNSGPSLEDNNWQIWQKQREVINKWLQTFNWPELENVNCVQKTWGDGPYGRDKDFYGENNKNRNVLSTASIARIYEALMTNSLLPKKATTDLKGYLRRSLDKSIRIKNPENQIDGFLGEGLTESSQLWSKAGLMSEVRHDVGWWIVKGNNPMLAVVFTKGNKLSKDTNLLPSIASEFNKYNSIFNI
tara:strand:+ start:647 stop:1552 length:906 start_codon:yes stop_codon:yes gene_type:complete